MKLNTNLKGRSKATAFELGSKTICYGPNGSGKSTIVDSLCLCLTGEAYSPNLGKSLQTLGALAPEDGTIDITVSGEACVSAWKAQPGKRAEWNKPQIEVRIVNRLAEAFMMASGEKRAMMLLDTLERKPKIGEEIERLATELDIRSMGTHLTLSQETATRLRAVGKGGEVDKRLMLDFCTKQEIDEYVRPPGILKLNQNQGVLLHEIEMDISAAQQKRVQVIQAAQAEIAKLPGNHYLIKTLRLLWSHFQMLEGCYAQKLVPESYPCSVCKSGELTLDFVRNRRTALEKVIGDGEHAIEMKLVAFERESEQIGRDIEMLEAWRKCISAESPEAWRQIAAGFNNETVDTGADDKDRLKKLQGLVNAEALAYCAQVIGVFAQRFKRNLPATVEGSIECDGSNVSVFAGLNKQVEARALSGAERSSVVMALSQVLAKPGAWNVIIIDDVWFDDQQLKAIMNAAKAGDDKETYVDQVLLCAVGWKGKLPKGWTEINLGPEKEPAKTRGRKPKAEVEAEVTEEPESVWETDF